MLKKSLQILAVVAVMLATAISAHAKDVTVVLDEKFAAFTDGSAESPASTDISGYSGKLAKTLSGWSGRKIYEAGEALFIGEGGNLQTARYNMSTLNGNCRVSLRLKAKADYGEAVALYVSYNQVATFVLEDNQWTDVSIVTDRGSSSAYIKLQPMFEGVVVDHILIEQSKSFVMTPDVYQPTNATGTSFTATWKRVTGATGYLLNVYSKAADGSREYFLKDAEYTTTSAKVEGLTDGVQYFFTVRAKVNDNISEESEEIEVIKAIESLAAPEALPATQITTAGFTANWEAVANAENYMLNVYGMETFNEAATKTVLAEDFSGVTKGSMDGIEFGKLTEGLDAYTNTPGWVAHNHAFAAGYIVLAPYSDAAQLYTPSMNLTHATTITVNMAEYSYKYYTGGKVTVTLYDAATDAALDSKEFEITEAAFADFTFTTNKGTENSYFEIAYSGSNKIFINDVKISMAFLPGSTYSMLIGNYETDATSYEVVKEAVANVVYTYNVVAMARSVDSSGNIITVKSEPSKTITVNRGTGVEKVAANTSVSVRNSSIVITADNTEAQVFTAAGTQVATTRVNGETTIDVVPGIYIVKAAGKVAKVLVK